MLHFAFILAHALFGAAALGAGVIALERPTTLLRAYVVALVLMLVSLGAAVVAEWSIIDPATRILFVALTALGVFVVGRGIEAWRVAPRNGEPPSARYGHAVGFTIIALTDAFFVILVLDLGGPGWAMVAVAVLIAVVGHFALNARLAMLERRWKIQAETPGS